MASLNERDDYSQAGRVSVEWRTSPDIFSSRIRRFADVPEAVAFMASHKQAFLGEYRCKTAAGTIVWTTQSACKAGIKARKRIPPVHDLQWSARYAAAIRRSRYGVLARKILRKAVDQRLITHADGRAITNAIRRAFEEPTLH